MKVIRVLETIRTSIRNVLLDVIFKVCKVLKGRIHGYAHVRDSINQTTILRFLNNLSAKKTLSNVLDDSNRKMSPV